jgi:hypothetical protein
MFQDERHRTASSRALPRVTRSALRLVWQASRSGFLTAATFQILGAAMTTLLVLASKLALDALLAAERAAAGPGALVPVVLLISVVTAVSAAAATLQAQQQRLLAECVSAAAWDRMLEVTGRVSLEYFECPPLLRAAEACRGQRDLASGHRHDRDLRLDRRAPRRGGAAGRAAEH